MTSSPDPWGDVPGHLSRACEILPIVRPNLIPENATLPTFLLRKVRQCEHQHSARIVFRRISVDVRPDRVLDLDPRHVLPRHVVPNNCVLALPHVDPGIGRADRLALLDQHVPALDRIQAVGTVVRTRAARPFHANTSNRHPVGPGDLECVPPWILDGQVLDREPALGHQHPLASGPRRLIGESKNRAVRPRASNRHTLHRQGQRSCKVEGPRPQQHHVSRFCLDQCPLNDLLCITTRCNGPVTAPHQGSGDERPDFHSALPSIDVLTRKEGNIGKTLGAPKAGQSILAT